MSNTAEIIPITTLKFGLASHSYQEFSAIVPAHTTREALEDPLFWANVKSRLKTFDEIRVVAEDGSMVARLLVAYADLQSAHCRVLEFYQIENCDPEELQRSQSRFECRQKGVLKWCICDTATDEVVKSGLPTRAVAERELEEWLRAQSL